ncbi:hypothetical protein N7467_008589 [Penicillium canescens]|nr:hypothetical protein N7467_008589 [Penicillium canescens]
MSESFLYYISGTDAEKTKVKALKANVGDSKNINKIANSLYDGGVTGIYNTQTMWEGVNRNDVPQLFKVVGSLVGQDRNKDTPQRQWAVEARARVDEGRTATRNRSVGNLLRWKYDNKNQKYPYREEIPRQPEMVTNGDFPEKMSKSEGSNDARGWPTVDLEQAKTTIEEKKNVKDFDIQEWIKKSDDLEVPRKDGESDDA